VQDKLFCVGWNILDQQGLIAIPHPNTSQFMATEEQLSVSPHQVEARVIDLIGQRQFE